MGFFLGTLVGTFLISRLIMYFVRKIGPRSSEPTKLIVVYAAVLIFSTIVYGYSGDTSNPQFLTGLILYLPSVIILFVIDAYSWHENRNGP